MSNETQDSNPNANPNVNSGNPESQTHKCKRSANKKNKHDAPARGRWKWGQGRKTAVIFARVPVEYAAHLKTEMQAHVAALVQQIDARQNEKKE